MTPPSRVLVVEDEPLLAMMLEGMLEDSGYEVAASAGNLRSGLEAAGRDDFDLAILDVTLGRESSFPIADLLEERGVPFVFASGHGSGALPDQHAARAILSKPFTLEQLQHSLSAIVATELGDRT